MSKNIENCPNFSISAYKRTKSPLKHLKSTHSTSHTSKDDQHIQVKGLNRTVAGGCCRWMLQVDVLQLWSIWLDLNICHYEFFRLSYSCSFLLCMTLFCKGKCGKVQSPACPLIVHTLLSISIHPWTWGCVT